MKPESADVNEEQEEAWLRQACAIADWVPHALERYPEFEAAVRRGERLADVMQGRWGVRRATVRRMFKLGGTQLWSWAFVPDLLAVCLDRLPPRMHPVSDADWLLWSRALNLAVQRGASGSVVRVLMPLVARSLSEERIPDTFDAWLRGCAQLMGHSHVLAPQMSPRQREAMLVRMLLRRRPRWLWELVEEVDQTLWLTFREIVQSDLVGGPGDDYPVPMPVLDEIPGTISALSVQPIRSIDALQALAQAGRSCLETHPLRMAMGQACYYVICTKEERTPLAIFAVAFFSCGQAPLLIDVRDLRNRPPSDDLKTYARRFAEVLRHQGSVRQWRAQVRACRRQTLSRVGGRLFWVNWRATVAAALPLSLLEGVKGWVVEQVLYGRRARHAQKARAAGDRWADPAQIDGTPGKS